MFIIVLSHRAKTYKNIHICIYFKMCKYICRWVIDCAACLFVWGTNYNTDDDRLLKNITPWEELMFRASSIIFHFLQWLFLAQIP